MPEPEEPQGPEDAPASDAAPERDRPSEADSASKPEPEGDEKPEADGKDEEKEEEGEKKEEGEEKEEGKSPAAQPLPEHTVASPFAIEKLKERLARAEKEKKPRPVRRRHLSEEERKALWHKAVIKKARKLKIMTDVLLIFMFALVIGVHFVPFIPFVGEVPADTGWKPKTGYELMRHLVEHGRKPLIKTVRDKVRTERYPEGREVADRATGRPLRGFDRDAKADLLGYFLLAIPAGAALLVLLYLLDYLVWMGRPLPGLSALWGFGSVGYLMYVRVPRDSTWEILGYNASLAWYLLLVPLFLVGVVSMLRFVISQRWKRYEFAGLPVPGRAGPADDAEATKVDEPAEGEGPSGQKADEDPPADAPDEAERPAGDEAPPASDEASDRPPPA